MKITYFEKYADLIVDKGIGLQKGENVVITAPIEAANFVKILIKTAYEKGAQKVIIDWTDDEITKLAFEYQNIELFENVPEYIKQKYNYYNEISASFIYLSGSDPDNLTDVDSQKVLASNVAMQAASKIVGNKRMADQLKWTIVGVPTKKWAQKVFPNDPKSYEKLWVEILKTVRINQSNPNLAWAEHTINLKRYSDYLNNAKFDKLVFSNAKGTDLEVGLPKGYIFAGGGSIDPSGVEFIANMPTEEVFSLPDKNNVNGIVYSSKPLNYSGQVIDNFWLEFKDGRVIDCGAEQNEDVLKQLISVDDGAQRLGEVAIVSANSPISLSNILYYNTLFDENASCHLALGRAYPTCLENSQAMTKEELDKIGVNDSSIHVDFMFGTPDLKITGVTKESSVVFFENGNFVEELI